MSTEQPTAASPSSADSRTAREIAREIARWAQQSALMDIERVHHSRGIVAAAGRAAQIMHTATARTRSGDPWVRAIEDERVTAARGWLKRHGLAVAQVSTISPSTQALLLALMDADG